MYFVMAILKSKIMWWLFDIRLATSAAAVINLHLLAPAAVIDLDIRVATATAAAAAAAVINLDVRLAPAASRKC